MSQDHPYFSRVGPEGIVRRNTVFHGEDRKLSQIAPAEFTPRSVIESREKLAAMLGIGKPAPLDLSIQLTDNQ